MIVRFENWGAWVKLESMPAVVALDRDGVRALGLDGGAEWTTEPRSSTSSAPIEVHLAVTARCGAGCKGCYVDARPEGPQPPLAVLESELDALHDAGVFTVAIGGGEPTSRSDLEALANAARARNITPVLTTSGLGLSETRAKKLRGFAQVNVSYDGAGQTYADVRGFDGAASAERAIDHLVRAGIRVGANVVLTRSSFARLGDTLARARSLGACEAQLLRYKPSGRAASIDYFANRLSVAQGRELGPVLRTLARALCSDGRFQLRIDCALVPFLCADEELASNPERLARLGVLGCEAGGVLAAVNVDGRVAPCSFAAPTGLAAAELATGYASDLELGRWRAYNDSPPEPCASCALRPLCKGGCKVVATFVSGGRRHGPDPECPRVVSFEAARS